MKNFETIIKNFQNKHILIVGDLFLDEYIYGDMVEISKEGPIPVVNVKERSYFPSAAGYTAAALKALGLNAHLAGFVGHDTNGKILIDELVKHKLNIDGVFIHEKMKTNTKIRINAGKMHTPMQEILRVDSAYSGEIKGSWQSELLQVILKKIELVDAIILVDKLSGIIAEDFMKKMVDIAQKSHKPIIADSDRLNHTFRNFDLIIANDTEASSATHIQIADSTTLKLAGTKLLTEQANDTIVITRGADGMTVFEKNGHITDLPTQPQKVFNVIGAGETVTATITAALVGGAIMIEAARLANNAAGISVRQSGNTVVSRDKLVGFMRRQLHLLDAEKIVSLDELKLIVDKEKEVRKTIVWTNGCFDLMHVGHILYLEKAKTLGDILIVGLNSDASVRQSKGSTRPIVEETQRAKLLSSLSCVDYVTIFSDETPMSWLKELKPDIYVKGGDYTIDTINQQERKLIESYGGRIELMPGIEGMSTTHLIDRILKANKY